MIKNILKKINKERIKKGTNTLIALEDNIYPFVASIDNLAVKLKYYKETSV